jgi:FkbM family methyltransferase
MKITKEGFAVIETDSHISKWVEETGKLDHDINCFPFIKEFIEDGDYVIDAGAFIADHTIFYSKQVGESGKVFAFEPNKEAYECLVYNMSKRENVYCFNNFLSNRRDKRASINNSDKNKGAAFIIQGNDIISMTIDELELIRCNFIKIDCEGSEYDILIGAKKTIEKFKPTMLIEINSSALLRNNITSSYLIHYIESLGYSVRNIYAEQIMYGNQFDVICTPIII